MVKIYMVELNLFLTIVDSSSDLFIGAVSADTLVDPINVCNTLELFDVVYIKQQNIGYITNGDLVFYNHLENLPFPGNGEYYKIKAINTATRIVTIDSFGSISSITLTTCI